MKIKQIGKMNSDGQDGALFGKYLFRFGSDGTCQVFDAESLYSDSKPELPKISEFTVGDRERIVPHFNAVVFGPESFDTYDEFPILYANVYNNYAKETDRLEGVCCAYRIQRDGDEFSATLVQLIRIGFTADPLWRSAELEDVRPYGNFVIDRERSILYAFTMRDGEHKTRYFSFPMPRPSEGEMSPKYGIPVVTLEKADIISYFDTEYHNYIQGATHHAGLIYSSEGFDENIHPALRVIDPAEERQICHMDLTEYGYSVEAEWIDFIGERCIYSDAFGNIFEIEFDI